MTLTKEEIDNSCYLTLRSRPTSHESDALVEKVLSKAEATLGVKTNKKLKLAIGVLIADLLKAAEKDPKRYSYRHMSAGSFTDGYVGHSSFRRSVETMEQLGLLKIVPGEGGLAGGKGYLTRFRATEKMLSLAKAAGLKKGDWSKHVAPFPRPSEIRNPLSLKTSTRWAYGRKEGGSEVSIHYAVSPARELAERVNKLNAFFARASIEPADCHYAFQRMFSQGDDPAFNWDRHGRLYSLGESYQQLPSEERGAIKLDGEDVLEIDIRASHLTILHAKLSASFDPIGTDPYVVRDVPREVVKAWVTMTLGYHKFQTRWSSEIKEKYSRDDGADLQKAFPINCVRERVLEQLPALKAWPSCPVRWGELQYLESEAVIGAVERLAFDFGIPALPVHDSIIVPVSQKERALEVLSATFEDVVGVKPALIIKSGKKFKS